MNQDSPRLAAAIARLESPATPAAVLAADVTALRSMLAQTGTELASPSLLQRLRCALPRVQACLVAERARCARGFHQLDGARAWAEARRIIAG
jgi:hypothetical protein